MLTQPAEALTDLLLGLVACALALGVRRQPDIHRYWQATFWWAGAAALAGFVHHGVLVRWPAVADVSWPVISVTDAAATAMRSLTAAAAGGITPSIEAIRATVDAVWDPDLVADHAGVVGVDGTAGVPDVLVGLAWPAVFAAVADATTADGHPVVEGMLDLVHLDHAIDVTAGLPETTRELSITAATTSVGDTDMGRVVTVEVDIDSEDGPLATLVERFAVRGRPGDAELSTRLGPEARSRIPRHPAPFPRVGPPDAPRPAGLRRGHRRPQPDPHQSRRRAAGRTRRADRPWHVDLRRRPACARGRDRPPDHRLDQPLHESGPSWCARRHPRRGPGRARLRRRGRRRHLPRGRRGRHGRVRPPG